MKKFIDDTTIINQILGLKVSVIVSNLLMSALVIEKLPIKIIFKDKSIQFYINILGLVKVLDAFTSYFWYFIRLSKVKVYLKDGFKVTTSLNTKAKINIMTKKLMKDVNLTIK